MDKNNPPSTRGLFVVFHGFADYNGISKKIGYQKEALSACGLQMELCYMVLDSDGRQSRKIGDGELQDFGYGLKAKIFKRICYKPLIEYIKKESISFLYVRYNHNASPILTYWFRQLKKMGVPIYLEIPTWPYDLEYTQFSFKGKISWYIDRCFRKSLMKNVSKIVTFSEEKIILGKQTLCISNGIDFSKIPLRQKVDPSDNTIRFIGVAELHFWHGFDRMIAGLSDYYTALGKQNLRAGVDSQFPQLIFEIAGEGFPAERQRLEKMVIQLGLQQYVHFLGNLSGSELDNLFDKADLGVASLGRHRSGITHIKTLKTREYAARGLPFLYSEIDDDFERSTYIYKVPANDAPIDMKGLIHFYECQKFVKPASIRADVDPRLSWKSQMQKVWDDWEKNKKICK